jgi:glutamate/tyrosine decarboxylase-like PLP-dependent enzyme
MVTPAGHDPGLESSINDAASEMAETSLDPSDWDALGVLAHQVLDDAIKFVRTVRDRPVWQPVPREIQEELLEPLPEEPLDIRDTYQQFQKRIFPYATGNIHPRFFGWVHGNGMVTGILSEMLAAAMNSNCGGRDHAALYVERCIMEWCKQLFDFPPAATGVLLSGTSMGSLVALAVARNAKAGWDVREEGVSGGKRLVAYASVEVHESIAKAIELLGIGRRSLRLIAVDRCFRMDLQELRAAVAKDRADGLLPFCVVGTAGTVNTGAVDDLEALAGFAKEEGLWFHVDGAFGALCVMNDVLRPRVKGIQLADSIAFDFHKWMHVPYDAGCALVRDGDAHWKTFTTRPPYLQNAARGLAGGGRWFCEYGPELSRGFRALKIWFALKQHGARALGESMLQNCRQAEYLAGLVRRTPELELMAEPSLNIVCFRFRCAGLPDKGLDALNREIVADLHERGIAAPSTTRIGGRLAIRANITNHRCRRGDFDVLANAVVMIGKERVQAASVGLPTDGTAG